MWLWPAVLPTTRFVCRLWCRSTWQMYEKHPDRRVTLPTCGRHGLSGISSGTPKPAAAVRRAARTEREGPSLRVSGTGAVRVLVEVLHWDIADPSSRSARRASPLPYLLGRTRLFDPTLHAGERGGDQLSFTPHASYAQSCNYERMLKQRGVGTDRRTAATQPG